MLDIIHGTVCDPREPLDGESQLAMLQANERAQADLMLGLMLQVWNGLFMELCHTARAGAALLAPPADRCSSSWSAIGMASNAADAAPPSILRRACSRAAWMRRLHPLPANGEHRKRPRRTSNDGSGGSA